MYPVVKYGASLEPQFRLLLLIAFTAVKQTVAWGVYFRMRRVWEHNSLGAKPCPNEVVDERVPVQFDEQTLLRGWPFAGQCSASLSVCLHIVSCWSMSTIIEDVQSKEKMI